MTNHSLTRAETSFTPYKGLVVLDVSQGIAGPNCGTILGLQGATVYKVEPPAGDWGRNIGATVQGMSALSIASNGGKRSVCIDASKPSGAALMTRLAKQADIVIESFRPGVAARVGLDPEQLRRERPDQIILSVSGFGDHGPGAKRPGTDSILQALSGLVQLNAGPDGTPKMVPMYLIDSVTSLYAAQLVSAALHERANTGQGRHLKISLLEAAASLQAIPQLDALLSTHLTAGQPPVPSGIFKTQDNYIRITSVSQRTFEALCRGLDQTEWLNNAEFATDQARIANSTKLNAAVANALEKRTTRQWLDTLEPLGVLCAPVNDYKAFREDPQVKEMCIFNESQQPALGSVPIARHPGMPQTPPPSPLLGQHSKEVLTELGLDETEIATLVDDEVVYLRGETKESTK